MEDKQRKRRKRGQKKDSPGPDQTRSRNSSAHTRYRHCRAGFRDIQQLPHAEAGGSSSAVGETSRVNSRASNAAAASDCDRAGSHTTVTMHCQGGRQYKGGETSSEAGRYRQHHKKQRGDSQRNFRDDHFRNPGTSYQDSSQDEGCTAEKVQRRPRGWKKGHYHEDHRDYYSQSYSQRGYGAAHEGGFGGGNYRGNNSGGYRGRKKRRQWTEWRYGDGNSSQSHGSPSETGTSSSTASATSFQIPGFYYDPEKKKYFKIQPSSDVREGDENVVTNESIRKKQAETRRQKDLAAFEVKATQTSVLSKPFKRIRPDSFSSVLLNGYQRGDVNRFKLERNWITHSAMQLHRTDVFPVSHSFPSYETPLIEHVSQMEISKEHDQLLCWFSLCGSAGQRLKLIDLKEARRTQPRQLSVQFPTSLACGLRIALDCLTSICWADFHQYPNNKIVLFTALPYFSQFGNYDSRNLASIYCLEDSPPENFRRLDYNLGVKTVWTCAWNSPKQQFGVGVEKGCAVIDVKTRQMWQFNTIKSDTLAQVFSKEDGGNTMYAGVRQGSILQFDWRHRPSSPVHSMNQQGSVCCLRLSPDEHHLYAADFKGQIKMWDARMNKVVTTYDGLCNSRSRLPFYVDETQSLLYSVGEDCYTKIWNVKTGKLLLSVPPPEEASVDFIPSVHFSTRWGGSPGNIGLIMGMRDKFYLYSLHSFEDDIF